MSDKPSPQPSTSKPAAKPAGGEATVGTKPGLPIGKCKSGGDAEDSFDFLAPPQSQGELGRLAYYRILKVLGKGGMGIVFMAEDTKLHRMVALKVMLPAIAKKAIARDRFLREARATAKIEHDHIVTIYEVSNEDCEVPYLAMQFLKGMTLEDWLRAGKTLNVPQLMRIGKEIAKGLAAAHSHQLIHRDIKPSNIWLDAANKGRVKILDFGLARPTNEETHLTQEGMILGSPAYMSPEQARGQDVDERVDLFSLGCVLYRLCSGKLPFAGKDAMSMLLAITTEEPAALKKLNGDLPPALAELVHKLLAKKPDERPTSAKAVVQTIQNIERDWIANSRTTATRPVPHGGSTTQDATIAEQKAFDHDPALEESAITDLELPSTPTPSATAAPPRQRSWIFAGLGCSALSVVSVLCCMAILFASKHGQVQVTVDDDARLLFEDKELMLIDHHKMSHAVKFGEPQRLPPGGYKVDLSKLRVGVQVDPSEFSLGDGETLEIVVRYVAPNPLKPGAPAYTLVDEVVKAKKLQKEWAAYLKAPVEEATHLKAKMTLIPAGEFMMGSSKEQIKAHWDDMLKKFKKDALPPSYPARVNNEAPAHRVRISKPFYIGTNEVTFGEFKKFVAANNYRTLPETSQKGGTGIEIGRETVRKPELYWVNFGAGYTPTDESPVSNITWKDAEEFCKWLSNKEKKVYRLPTEAEWEYACRAGTTSLWSFGDDLRESYMRGYMHYHVPFTLKFPTNPASPKLVGKKSANGFGLHDMHGNVAEMCSDYWDPTFYQRGLKDSLTIDPKKTEPGKGVERVVRGGSFLDTAYVARSAYRNYVDPNYGYAPIGFRLVCEAPLPAE